MMKATKESKLTTLKQKIIGGEIRPKKRKSSIKAARKYSSSCARNWTNLTTPHLKHKRTAKTMKTAQTRQSKAST